MRVGEEGCSEGTPGDTRDCDTAECLVMVSSERKEKELEIASRNLRLRELWLKKEMSTVDDGDPGQEKVMNEINQASLAGGGQDREQTVIVRSIFMKPPRGRWCLIVYDCL